MPSHTLTSTLSESQNAVGGLIHKGFLEELVCFLHPVAFIDHDQKRECHRELEEMKAAKRTFEVQLAKVNQKI